MVILLSIKFDTIKRKRVIKLKKIINRINLLLPLSVLLIVLTYSISLLFFSAYYGFHIENDGLVTKIYDDDIPINLGDQIISINSTAYEDFLNDPYGEEFSNQSKGSIVNFEIERDDEILNFKIKNQSFIFEEFKNRFPNMYLVGLIFWAIGTFAFFVIRPRNIEWKILIATCFLTAIWLTTGGMAIYRMYYAGIVFRVSFWLSIPCYLLLHSLIGVHKSNINKKIIIGLYSPFILLSILQIFKVIGPFLYSFGLFLAILGSLGILVFKFFKNKKNRNDILFIILTWSIILVPQIFINVIFNFENFPDFGLSLILLPLLPLSYLNILFKREVGKYKLRKNPLIATYMYFSILLIFISITLSILLIFFEFSPVLIIILLFLILLISIVSTFNYIPFVKWVSSKFLGTIYPIDNVINLYSEQISQQYSIEKLKELIQKNLTNDLLIDQSIIVLMSDFKDDYQEIAINETDFIPNRDKLTELHIENPLEDPFESNSKHKWIRLILPIKTSDSFYGWWLIGEHSPDDVFSFDLIETLEVISIQIAMKISSIFQTQHIESMYQIRVTREDAQESYILRELHDTVLNEFALLKEHVESKNGLDEKTSNFFEIITNSIRNTISGLRPPMQDYPLYNSIEDYCFQINQTRKIQVHNNIFYEPQEKFRYDEKLKLNLYRMIQQGINNALAHAEANEITLYGRLDEDHILIEITDDGKGMDLDIDFSSLDAATINQLIQNKHFGIAGMYERAKLINASFDIESELYEGTNIIIEWYKDKNNYVKVLDE